MGTSAFLMGESSPFVDDLVPDPARGLELVELLLAYLRLRELPPLPQSSGEIVVCLCRASFRLLTLVGFLKLTYQRPAERCLNGGDGAADGAGVVAALHERPRVQEVELAGRRVSAGGGGESVRPCPLELTDLGRFPSVVPSSSMVTGLASHCLYGSSTARYPASACFRYHTGTSHALTSYAKWS